MDKKMLFSFFLMLVVSVSNAKVDKASIDIKAGGLVADKKDGSIFLNNRVEATQGDMKLIADEVQAYSNNDEKDNNVIGPVEKIEAIGNIVAQSPDQSGKADKAEYDVKNSHLRLTGNNVHLVSKQQHLTSGESVDYWEKGLKAIAKKNVLLKVRDNVIYSDEIIAYFKRNEEKKLVIDRAYSPGNVKIVTKDETITGDKGKYDATNEMVYIDGNVTITRIKNNMHLKGAHGVVNLRTGVSKLLSAGGKKGIQGIMTNNKGTN